MMPPALVERESPPSQSLVNALQELRSSKAHVHDLERAREAGDKRRQEDRAVRNQLNQVHASNLQVARQYEKAKL